MALSENKYRSVYPKKFFCIFSFCLLLSQVHAQIADRVFTHGKIYTKNGHFDEAIAIKDGIIIYTGSNDGIARFTGISTKVTHLWGRLVLPGLHDVHMHPLEAFTDAIGDCFLSDTITHPETYIKELKACNIPINSNGWKMAYGYDIYVLMKSKIAPRLMLDEICDTVPFFVWESTSHSAWLNTKALQVAGFTKSTPEPVGGYIVKDADGEPTGLVLDNAGDIALQKAIAINPVIQQQNYEGLVKTGLPLIAKNGITSFCEARTYWKQNFIETWKQVKATGLLTARVVLTPWGYPGDDINQLIDTLAKLYDKGDDLLKINEVKLYADGLTFNTTAAYLQPYDTSLGFPFTNGLNYNTEDRMAKLITALEKIGYDFHIHAIGDRGVRESLNAIEEARKINGYIGARHRITHLEAVDSADYNRFKELHVIADMQVAGDFTKPGHWHDNDFLIGPYRDLNFIPLRSIYNTGAVVTLSSDYDVSYLSPFVGMEHALTRTPQNLNSVEDVVKCYTIHGAYTMRQEEKTGSLEVGKLADMIVADRDIFSIPVHTISHTKVELTLLGGKEVYVSPTFYQVTDTIVNTKGISCILYPQEADDEENIRLNSDKHDRFLIKIYDKDGKLMVTQSHKHISNFSTASFDTLNWKEGDYTVKIFSGKHKRICTKTFTVKRDHGLHDF